MVDFAVDYNGDKDTEIFLFKVVGKEYVLYTANERDIQLKDDGDQSNGDLMQGDEIYSARVIINEAEQGDIEFVAGVEDDGKWQYSNSISISIFEELTNEETDVAIDTVEDTKQQLQQLFSENKNKEEIKTEIVNVLKQKTEIKKVDVSESGKSVWYALESGILGAVTLESDSQENFENQTYSTFAASNQNLIFNNSDNKDVLGNLLVAIFSAHGIEEGNKINNMLHDSPIAFNVKHFKDSKASVDEFKKMSQYGAIFFDTRGEALFKGDLKQYLPYLNKIYSAEDEKVVILTGEKMSDLSAKEYSADLKTGRIITVDGYYAITSAFVEYYGKLQGKTMPDTFIYANTNQSLHNDAMAKEFINNGAQTYVGYKDTVVKGSMTKAISNMLNGDTVGKAVEGAGVLGNTNTIFAAPQDFINGSLEEELNGWVGAGHVDTISKLGNGENPKWHTLRPTKGNRMGIVSSGVDKGALFGRQSWIYQTFTVPKNATNLKFDYNVVSSEPMVFINSRYDDKFKATIVLGEVKEPRESDDYSLLSLSTGSETYISPARDEYINNFNGGVSLNTLSLYEDNGKDYTDNWVENTVDEDEIIIGFESINSSDWGQDFFDDRQRVDTIFPYGDETTYMTGWKTVSYDVSRYQGQTISLKLQTWDLGDTAYPTAVLFDNVHLTSSTYTGVGIQGREEVQIPISHKPSNNYFYQVGKVDQYGDILTGEITTYEDERGYIKPIRELTANVRLAESVQGVKLDEMTGVLTVTSEAQEGKITLIAYNDDGQEKALVVNLKPPAPSKPNDIRIYGPYEITVEDNKEEQFEADVRDQYGNLIDDYKVKWSLSQEVEGITIDKDTGILSINIEQLGDSEDFFYTIIVASLEEHDISSTHYVTINKIDSEENIDLEYEINRVIDGLDNNMFDDEIYPGDQPDDNGNKTYRLSTFVADKVRELINEEYKGKIKVRAGNAYGNPETDEHVKLESGYYRIWLETNNYTNFKDIKVDTIGANTPESFKDVLGYNIYIIKLKDDITVNIDGWDGYLLNKLNKMLDKEDGYKIIEGEHTLTIKEAEGK